jgi:hypothetical protein
VLQALLHALSETQQGGKAQGKLYFWLTEGAGLG